MMRIWVILLFLFTLSSVHGQSLDSLENRMAEVHLTIGEAPSDEERLQASDQLRDYLLQAFEMEGTFQYPFEKVYKMASITSPDNAFRLFNWHLPKLNGEHSYYAFILFPDKGTYVELKDTKSLSSEDEAELINAENWYGALYYEIHPISYQKETYYTLVGWDGKDRMSNMKVLDVLNIDRKNRISLGRPIFALEEGFAHRRVFEYSDKVSMTLRYLEPKDAIVFDKLEPLEAGLEGQYAYYGPGTGLSGYQLNKVGLWELVENMDMTRPKDQSDARFNFPDRPDLNRKRDKTNPLIGK